jgi:hypothetical protein
VNHHGRELHIHGVNLSLGYPFDPKWFACGHSPLCVEVNRLVRSGVVVVVAAGNSGYGTLVMKGGKTDACLDLTINDPGNAECAITVGSTHRDMPYMYGVSYFSSKGPTGDGRCSRSLLAPGEKIISCAAPKCKLVKDEADSKECNYFETSGTRSGRAARKRRHRGISFHPQGVHRRAGTREENLHLNGDRPRP